MMAEINPLKRAKISSSNSSQVLTHKKLGVSLTHHQHTGNRVPIRYTSYTLLFFLLVLAGSILLLAGHVAKADQTAQGDINLSGKLLGPPPSTAAVITNPSNGQRFSSNIIDVDGSCTAGLIVEIFRNDSFAGSARCQSQGSFHLSISLIPGQNDLKARIRDDASQYGPDSTIVGAFYDVPKTPTAAVPQPPLATALPFLIYTQSVQRGTGNGGNLQLKYEINGGKAPYAIAINWGDGTKVDAVVQSGEGDFTLSHKYTSAGQYTLSISGNDAAHNRAYVQSVAAVQGLPVAAAVSGCRDFSGITCNVSNQLQRLVDELWPAFIVACLMTVSFWLGERVVYGRLRQFNQA